jgi:hypothetical protein
MAEEYSSPARGGPCEEGGVGQPCGVLSQLREGVVIKTGSISEPVFVLRILFSKFVRCQSIKADAFLLRFDC